MGFQIPKIQLQDDKLNLINDHIRKSFNDLNNIPFLNGIYLDDISLSVGDNEISHNLGRKIIGYFVLNKNSNAQIYDKLKTYTGDLNRKLPLNSSAGCIVDLWVF